MFGYLAGPYDTAVEEFYIRHNAPTVQLVIDFLRQYPADIWDQVSQALISSRPIDVTNTNTIQAALSTLRAHSFPKLFGMPLWMPLAALGALAVLLFIRFRKAA